MFYNALLAQYRHMIAELTKRCPSKFSRAHRVLGHVTVILLLTCVPWQAEGQWLQDDRAQLPLGQSEKNWTPLDMDGVHDPAGPAIRQLQEPGKGLSELPAHESGNRVLWAKALDRGAINPRRAIKPSEAKVQVLDLDILMNLRGGMPIVRFPHRIHTQWLACDNCHEQLFKSQIGANKLSMYMMLQGEQCGLCHGSVAFPLTQCSFCHSVSRKPEGSDAPTNQEPNKGATMTAGEKD